MTYRQQVEIFHLLFLRLFSSQTAPTLYAVKGGCNLRFFFGSIRYSEDLDIDIQKIQKLTLENKVNKILASPQLKKALREYHILDINFTSPKQTNTTQRWKIQLQCNNTIPLNTKIEFSKRDGTFISELGNVTTDICAIYHLPPFRFSHYAISEAIQQKILALAHRSLTQARDVFDLYHLLHIEKPKKISLATTVKEKALQAISSIHFEDFKSQVVSFLESNKQSEFNSNSYWKTMCETVENFIENCT